MNAQHFSFGKAVFVRWEDSALPDLRWIPARELVVDVGETVSIGFVAACDGVGISIASSFTQDAALAPLSIPWGCITDIWEVDETKRTIEGSNTVEATEDANQTAMQRNESLTGVVDSSFL